MANLLMLAASMLVLLGHALAAGSTTFEDHLKSSIVRRHDTADGAAEAHLNALGEIEIMQSRSVPADNVGEVSNSFCNHDFLVGKTDSNDCDCDQCVPIMKKEECERAANYMKAKGLSFEPHHDNKSFVVSDGWQNPLPYPKNCFAMANGTVFYNPTETMPTTFQGTPICMRRVYSDGPTNTDGSTGCTGDFEAITDFHDCQSAWSCADGDDACRSLEFEWASDHIDSTAPKGCFRETGTKCVNFNHITYTICSVKGYANLSAQD
jgi:hypothetical protein